MAPVEAAAALVPQSIRDTGQLVVAIPTNEPPTQFYREGTKEMTGLNPDIARLLAGALDLDLQIDVTNFDAIIPGLSANRFDLTVSSMTPTSERIKQLDFVDYVRVGNGLGAQAGNPQGVAFDALCGKRVAVLKGSYQLTARVPEMVAECAKSGAGALEVLQFPDTQQAVSSVLSGRADAVFADAPIIAYAADQDARFEVVEENAFGNVGIGIPKDTDMLDAVSTAMNAVIESPEYLDMLTSYGLESMAIDDALINAPQA
ncbi:transporter substrate-binding domain-containing protein [Leucobacter sp. HY1910]